MTDQLVIESVNRVRLSMTLTDIDVPKGIRAIIEQKASEALKALDPVVVEHDPVFLLSQDKQDEMFLDKWTRARELADKIVRCAFLPFVKSLPLAIADDGRPDVEITILVDAPYGCRRFTYTLRDDDELDIAITEIPTLTLDTSVLFELWMEGHKISTVERLIELASSEPLSLRVTGRIREDVPKPPLAQKINQLPDLGVKLMGSVIRPNRWRGGIDQVGSTEFHRVYTMLTDPEYRQENKDWKDWDHLHAHYINRRHFFLTWDKGILCFAKRLKDELGLVVMKPEEYVTTIEEHG